MRSIILLFVLLMFIPLKSMAIGGVATTARIDVYYEVSETEEDFETSHLVCCFQPFSWLCDCLISVKDCQEKNDSSEAANDRETSSFQAETPSQASALAKLFAFSTMSQALKLVEHRGYQGDPTLTAWMPFFKSVQYVDTLHLQYELSNEYLAYLTENLDIKNLRALSFKGAGLRNWNEAGVTILLNFISRFSNVETLDLSLLTYDTPLLDLGKLPQFPNLTSLTISGDQVYNDDYLYALAEFLKKTPKLQSLRIENGMNFKFAGMQAVTTALREHCPNMTEFVTYLGVYSSIAVLTQVLKGCPHITKLHALGGGAQASDEAFDIFIEELSKSKVEDIKFSSFNVAPVDTYNKRVVVFFNALAKKGSVKNVDVEFTIVKPGNEYSPEVLAISNFVQGIGGSLLESIRLGYTKMNAKDSDAFAKSCIGRTTPLLINWQIDVFDNVVVPAFTPLINDDKVILNGTYKPHL